MILKKCVVISGGPGVSDVLNDQVVIVPPEDPEALAAAIRKVWEDSYFREETAFRGYHYATSLSGERELLNRILDCAMSWYSTVFTSRT